MSNCFLIDVSCGQVDERVVFESSDPGKYSCLSYSYETVVNARNNVDDFNVFNQNSKINYDSRIVRGIRVQGEIYTNSFYSHSGAFYVILYKTILGENNEIYSMHPADIVGSLNQWFLYREPETVLTYKTYKIKERNYFIQPNRSFRIDVSYNKPILFRPNDVIIVEYALLIHDYTIFKQSDFRVDATAEVRFDSV